MILDPNVDPHNVLNFECFEFALMKRLQNIAIEMAMLAVESRLAFSAAYR